MTIIAIIIIIAAVLLTAAIFFNRLIKYRMLMREAWSGINVQLKRRHDLIPNIVESVKGYRDYEKKILSDITAIRSRLDAKTTVRQKGDLEKDFSGMLRSVFALAESYPDLKTNKSFLSLHDNLVAIEDELQLARRYYNGTVRNYNIASESFPGNIFARAFGFGRADFFEIEYATERAVPDVKL